MKLQKILEQPQDIYRDVSRIGGIQMIKILELTYGLQNKVENALNKILEVCIKALEKIKMSICNKKEPKRMLVGRKLKKQKVRIEREHKTLKEVREI